MPIKRADIVLPTLPEKQVVSVPEMGGDVIVRPLLLSDRLALAAERDKGVAKSFTHFAALLSVAVVDEDGEPLLTRDEWEAWGARNYAAALRVWDVAWDLSGLDATAAEKNSNAQNSG